MTIVKFASPEAKFLSLREDRWIDPVYYVDGHKKCSGSSVH